MSLFVPPVVRATDANNIVLPGAKWYFYTSGGTTPAPIYTTSARTVAHTNPVVADSTGLFAPIFLDPTIAYRAVLKTSAGIAVPKGDFDPVNDDPVVGTIHSDLAALGDMLWDMRVKATSYRTRLGRFSDVYTDATGINSGASQYYDHDATRFVVGPQRAFKSTVAAEEDFNSIADWTTVSRVVGGIDPSDPDPAVGLVAEMDTGATPGNTATMRKLFGTIPATFGISVLMQMATTNTSAAEALEFQAQNANGHLLRMRIYSGAVQFFYDGAWNTAFAYGGGTTFYTEWWFDASFNSGSNYTIRLFAGTEELPGFTGDLPNGTGGENGWVGFIQYSSAVANRKARIAFLQVGSSALPQNMTLVSVAQDVVTEPTTVSVALLVEDVCLQTVFNTDLIVSISKDGGTNYYPVTLTNYDEVAAGILTVTCPVYLLAGSVVMPASGTHSVTCKIASANGRYFSLQGVAWRVDA